METKKMELAMRITRLREMLELSQEAMADKTGLTLAEYRAYERGQRAFNPEFLTTCAEVFHMDLAELLSGTRMKAALANRGVTVRQRNAARLSRNMTLTSGQSQRYATVK